MGDSIISVVAAKINALMVKQSRYDVYFTEGAETEVHTLARELEGVCYAEWRGRNEESVKFPLSRFEQTCYEVEDVLDEWNHAILKHEIGATTALSVFAPMKKVCSLIPSSSYLRFKKPAPLLPGGIAKKIIDVSAKFDEVLREKNRWGFFVSQSLSDPPHTSWRFPTGFFFGLEVDHDRGFDRDILVAKLVRREKELGIQVVSIVGDGGLGKTALAQLVYNDSRVEKYFDLRIWICVSDSFDMDTIAKGILESVREGSSSNTAPLDDMLEDVRECISGKRYLLVIDDFRDRDSRTWINLKGYLKNGEAGSSVLVTTRHWDAATGKATDDNIDRLGKFSDEECWLLLHDEEIVGEFEDIGELIARECKGSALIAHFLGRLLCSKSREEVRFNVLFKEVQQLKAAEEILFPQISWGNREFYATLKRCFSYCAIFPKYSNIVVEDVIGIWMTLGYLGSNTSDMKWKGRGCFDILARDSLLEYFEKEGLDGEIKSYRMPNIVHDFLQYLWKIGRLKDGRLNSPTCGACDPAVISTANEFLSLFCRYPDVVCNSICDCLKRLRVLSVPEENGLPRRMEILVQLRWLKLDGNQLSGEDLKTIFHLYYLQTLLLKNCKLEVIPGEIGNLFQLRCLDLSFNDDLKELPASVGRLKELLSLNVENCARLVGLSDEMKLDGNQLSGENLKTIFQLYNLQTLLLKNCKLEVIPGEIGNLIQLRCLDLSFNDDLKELPASMGRLKELRSLNVENCARLVRLPDEMDGLVNLKDLRHDLTFGVNGLCNLGLLKNMNLLSGTLQLKIRLGDDSLEDAVGTAREAKLSEKRDIERLVMEFEDEMKKEESSSQRRLDLINALEPQQELKSLEIWSYNGPNLPAWIVSPGLKHLRKLRIMNCDRISSLLPLANLQHLEEIEMFSLYGLQYVEREFLATTAAAGAAAFPELKKLTFRRFPNWKKWEDITAEEEKSANKVFMPRLRHLSLKLCTGLRELPHRLLRNIPSLQVLDISYSEKLEQRYGHMDSSVGESLFGEARFRIDWRR